MKADGSVLAELTPRFANGKLIKSRVVVHPNGQLWTTDGKTLCRLNTNGVAADVVGDAPKAENLNGIASVAIDENRNIYVLDTKTGAVHKFDERGVRKRVFTPNPTDFPESISSNQVAVTPSGAVYVEQEELSMSASGKYVHFGPDGERLGAKSFGFGEVTTSIYFQPNSTKHWRVGYQKIQLVEDSRTSVLTIDRGANSHWFSAISGAAQAPDGSKFAFLTSRGENEYGIAIVRADGVPEFTFSLPLRADGYAGLFLNRDKNELWVFTNNLQIQCFDLNRK